MGFVALATARAFLEFPEIVEVKSDGQAISSWESPIRVRNACGPYGEAY